MEHWLESNQVNARKKITTQRIIVKEVRMIRSPPNIEKHQDVTYFERAQAYPEYMVENCARGKEGRNV